MLRKQFKSGSGLIKTYILIWAYYLLRFNIFNRISSFNYIISELATSLKGPCSPRLFL
jgi:hypothetical protein